MTEPRTQREIDHALLAAGEETGWWNEHGVPAPFPDDFFDPDSGWAPAASPVAEPPDGESPF